MYSLRVEVTDDDAEMRRRRLNLFGACQDRSHDRASTKWQARTMQMGMKQVLSIDRPMSVLIALSQW